MHASEIMVGKFYWVGIGQRSISVKVLSVPLVGEMSYLCEHVTGLRVICTASDFIRQTDGRAPSTQPLSHSKNAPKQKPPEY